MVITLVIAGLLILVIFIFMNLPKFGKLPSRADIERIKKSSNYSDKSFKNKSVTPDLSDGATYYSVTKEMLFGQSKRVKPDRIIPAIKIDLHKLNANEDVLVWFGHSSYFMQTDGIKILVDPVFSNNASPVSFTTKAFAGTNIYNADDMPHIDILFISHDHWDHLDYDTILKLKNKIDRIVCGLGVGAHFERWEFDVSKITEMDWNESMTINNFEIHSVSARHFSGRGFKRNQSLWLSWVLITPSKKYFIGGDSGYDTHFKETGDQFGLFDLVILEDGQYDKSWKYIHMMPEEVLQAAQDLKAKKLLPVHHSKFAIANHDWDAPLAQVTSLPQSEHLKILTPMIGEIVEIENDMQNFSEWWK